MSRTSCGWRSATQPSTKKVARTPNWSNSASSRCVFATTRGSREAQVSRWMLGASAETWK
jgi:hypothetical protein